MNHRVHLLISGCLTVKFSGEWKTVNCSFGVLSALYAIVDSSGFSRPGVNGAFERSCGTERSVAIVDDVQVGRGGCLRSQSLEGSGWWWWGR